MTGKERREQLLDVGRSLFAQKGFDATSVEEIAARADVSKPVVYEHFGGKEGLYAVVVDREVRALLDGIRGSLTGGGPRELVEQAACAFLDYIEDHTEGFRGSAEYWEWSALLHRFYDPFPVVEHYSRVLTVAGGAG